jgi:hypothetical protein
MKSVNFESCVDDVRNTDTILLFTPCPSSDFKDPRCLRRPVTDNSPIYRGPSGYVLLCFKTEAERGSETLGFVKNFKMEKKSKKTIYVSNLSLWNDSQSSG